MIQENAYNALNFKKDFKIFHCVLALMELIKIAKI